MATPYKTVLITGASSGLGRGLAAWFAKRGDVTVFAAARRTAQLDSLRREVGDAIVPLALDVSQADATHERIVALDAECGGLELVIANAGVAPLTYGRAIDWKVVKNVVDVNVTGALATLCAALPGMVARGRGHLVGVSSMASFLAAPRMSTYCASKTFLMTWLASLRLDVAPLGLHVTSLHPGFVKTEMTANNRPGTLPFLMEADVAVERMAKAILRRAEAYAFPWQMRAAMTGGNLLPRSTLIKIFDERF
ncbi:MAG: SDR family NAD(P)-dependent oxidoreductase [Archangium sp.]|nr:SDR family NAD(P)-dependent oxidoreductase [Archangium sp.]